MSAPITAYKGFDANFQCRGFQYEVGQTVELEEGEPARCTSQGFHACEHPLNVLAYYSPNKSRFAVVELSGSIDREEGGDTKVCAARLSVKAELHLPELVESAVKWVFDRAHWSDGPVAKGDNEGATASGRYGAATASGWYGAATASGWSGAATASGRCGAATASGWSGAATASGRYGAATASGWYGAATASGEYGAATASGWSGAATASGQYGAATASGQYGAATAEHRTATAHASHNGRARGIEGSALHLDERNDDGEIIHVWAGIVGRDGIKPNTFYALQDGEPVEVSA